MGHTSATPYLVRLFRCLRLALHLLWMGIGTALIYPRASPEHRARLKKLWSYQLLHILSVRVECAASDAPPGSLIVANHISWLDIFATHAFRPAAFIAKAEIRQWPFIGWLSERNDTVFLRRGSHGHARTVNAEIDALLNSGIDVALFPEGTTTDGTHLLGFHAALLQPAIETQRPILPVAISYHDPSGELSLAPSFAGEITLQQCFLAILASRSLTVRLTPAAPIETVGKTRREVCQAAHTAIAAILARQPGFHPAHTAPGKPPGLPGE
ncbi:MAG: lysophospholipid acyltransferase family protein [Betaproteobacteria bacterium]